MKRFLLAIQFLFCLTQFSFAHHIVGGQIYYTFTGIVGGQYQYNVTLLLYRDKTSTIGAPLDPQAAIAIFDKGTNAMVWNSDIPINDSTDLHLISPSLCINNPPTVWYVVGRYNFNISLPASLSGYIITYQRCCRVDIINNLISGIQVGATYTAEIPGNSLLSTAPQNNSAHFLGIDTVAICANHSFTYNFGATDADGDSLSYYFCNAYTCQDNPPNPDPPLPPPYSSVPYAIPFSGSSPLGINVQINSNTGLITGIAPASGVYVVTVCVNEYRNGVLIATQRKDLQIKIADCDFAAATLEQPFYRNCKNFTVSFQDLTPSNLINSYFWDFGTGRPGDTSNLPNPTFTYPDTGTYVVKLVVNRHQTCSDSATSLVKIYPGFNPDFNSNGVCLINPVFFTDNTQATYGTVNSWSWDFGDGSTSTTRNPQHTYSTTGNKNVTLIVASSKGCIDTITKIINIIDKPPIALAFRDTLICPPDQLQLLASGTGQFSWTPNVNIINSNTGTPIVNPTSTITYHVTLDQSGCINDDSVRVRVTTAVSLQARADTTICRGDSIQLNAISNGLQFLWSPASQVSDPNIVNPIAVTYNTTTYHVTAFVSSCRANDSVTVRTIPYPVSIAKADTTICYNTPAQLHGSIVGSIFSWSPASSLSSATVLNPFAYPARTTSYILTVYDTLGCPKPGRDTAIVTVLPKMHPFAGHDTAVVVGQPLQFNASGGVNYFWTPATGLSSTNIPDPVGIYSSEMGDSVRYKLIVSNIAGCLDSTFVTVKIFKIKPTIFVPTAFTPNGDGLNDVIRPIAVGVKQILYFSIYNRWGQLVFTTTINGQGWDGKIGGKDQGTGVFVWMVKAIDYLDRPIFMKGTVTLIR